MTMRTKHRVPLTTASILILSVCLNQAQVQDPFGTITLMLGHVSAMPRGKTGWNKTHYKMPVGERDKLKTAERSRCEVTLANRKLIRIGEKTVAGVVWEQGRNEELNVERGKAWISIFVTGSTKRFRVRTPTAVCATRGTVYRLNCDSNHSSYWVYDGGIAVTPLKAEEEGLEDTTFFVNADEKLTVVKDFEEYLRQQEDAFRKFEEEEREEFEKFQREELEEFEQFVKEERDAFQSFKSIHFSLRKFNREKDRRSEWGQWNLERDAHLER